MRAPASLVCFETALGPSQLKELSQSAFGRPADRFPFA